MVPKAFVLAYLWYIFKAVFYGFVISVILTGFYSSAILFVSVLIGDFKFFTDLIEVKEFMEDSD